MEKKVYKFLLINLGITIMAIGLYYFLIPANLAVGGITGLAMVINHLFPYIHIDIIMFISNIILFTLAFLIIGKDFGGYTIYCSFLLTGMISFLGKISPLTKPLVDDILLNLIFGILIQGIGMGIVFFQNASTGGTDIVAKIINKFTNIEIGKALLLSDFLITLSAGLVFGIKLGLYALLGIITNALLIDKFIAQLKAKINVVVVSNENSKINDFIINELERGTTLYKAVGGFSNNNKNIINVVLNRREYIQLKNYIKSVDQHAFVSVHYVHEVLGEGFDLALKNL